MDKNNAKCPHCGAELHVSLNKGAGFCPTCRKQFDVDKAVKLYDSLHKEEKAEEKKIARGSDYLEVERILDRVEFYLARKEFDKATEELNSALEYTNTDYRVYFGLVRALTKNLTDYKDKSHLPYLNKAIECADHDEKSTITRLYKDFYHLSACSDEEIEQYKKEENEAIKTKLEGKLKEVIPRYMKLEQSIKKYPILFGAFYVLAVVSVILALVLKIDYLYFATFVTFIAGFFFTKSYADNKVSIANFNAVLDLYDVLDSFGLTVNEYRDVLDILKECRTAFSEKNNYTAQTACMDKLCDSVYGAQSKAAKDFVENHAVLKKHIDYPMEENQK